MVPILLPVSAGAALLALFERVKDRLKTNPGTTPHERWEISTVRTLKRKLNRENIRWQLLGNIYGTPVMGFCYEYTPETGWKVSIKPGIPVQTFIRDVRECVNQHVPYNGPLDLAGIMRRTRTIERLTEKLAARLLNELFPKGI